MRENTIRVFNNAKMLKRVKENMHNLEINFMVNEIIFTNFKIIYFGALEFIFYFITNKVNCKQYFQSSSKTW
jgi:mRNA deadenylase 3'-5' endonuclease subunit Ccr4